MDISTSLGNIPTAAAAIAAGIAAGNINIAGQDGHQREQMDLSDNSREAHTKHLQIVFALEAKRRARLIAAPTDVDSVKLALRQLGHPITLFGEGPGERRDRLKRLLAEKEIQLAVARDGEAVVAAAITSSSSSSSSSSSLGMGSVGIVGATAALGGNTISPSEVFAAISYSSALTVAAGGGVAADQQQQLFYTPASDSLVTARQKVFAPFSFDRATARIAKQKEEFEALASGSAAAQADLAKEDQQTYALYKTLKHMRPNLSQAADDRNLTNCALTQHDNGGLLATSSWSSVIRVWDPLTATVKANLKGHTDRVMGLAWHPSAHSNSGSNYSNGSAVLVSASADSTARIWVVPTTTSTTSTTAVGDVDGDGSMQYERVGGGGGGESGGNSNSVSSSSSSSLPTRGEGGDSHLVDVGLREKAVLTGHAARLCNVAFHPSGRFVGTTSFDKTWRLWDLETTEEILMQEGHTRETYPIAFHPDGALVATGDLAGVGRVWDLRSGQSIFLLRGHAKQIMCLDFSPNGSYIASGSDDHSSIVWDLRQQKTLYTLPAHAGLVSRVKFAPQSGEYLMTSSYDKTIKFWSTRDWSLVGTCVGHEGQVTGVDIFPQEEDKIVSVSFDRTFKTWVHESKF